MFLMSIGTAVLCRLDSMLCRRAAVFRISKGYGSVACRSDEGMICGKCISWHVHPVKGGPYRMSFLMHLH